MDESELQPLNLRVPTEAELDTDLASFGYNPKHIHKDEKLAVLSCCLAERALSTLVDSYRQVNEEQRKLLAERQEQLNAAIDSAHKLARQLDVALQEARAAAQDCETALNQRDNWRRKAEVAEQRNAACLLRQQAAEEELAATLAMLPEDRFIREIILMTVIGLGSQKAAAEKWGVSEQYISDVVAGRRKPGEKICGAVGYERVTMYRKVQP